MSTNANDRAHDAPDADLPAQPAGEAEATEVKGGASDYLTPQPVQGVLIGLLLPAVQPTPTSSLYKF